MKIVKLIVSDVLNHELTVIKPKKLNIFTGANMSGKSSLKDAMLWLLSGSQSRTDMINWHKKSGFVKAVLPNDVVIAISKTHNGSPKFTLHKGDKEQAGTNTEKRAIFQKQLGCSLAQVKAVFNANYFTDCSESDRKKMIFDSMGVEVTEKDIIGWLEPRSELDWIKILADKKFDFSNLDLLLKNLKTERTDSNRILKNLNADHSTLSQTEKPDKNLKKGYQENLKALQADRDTLLTKKGASVDIEAKERDKKRLGLLVNKENNAVPISSLEATIQELINKTNKMSDELNEVSKQRAVVDNQAKRTEFDKGVFKKLGDECPHCQQAISKEKQAQIMGDMDKIIGECTASLATLNAEHEKLNKELQLKYVEKNEKETQLSYFQESHLEAGEIEQAQKDLDVLMVELNNAKDGAQIELDIAELDSRIKKGLELIAKIDSLSSLDEKISKIEPEIFAQEKESLILDYLVKCLEPSGIKAELIGNYITVINDNLSVFSGLTELTGDVKLVTESGEKAVFELQVNGKPEDSCSKAQKLAVSLVFRAVLAKMSGLNILVLDDIDTLKEPLKAQANRMIFELMVKFDHTFIFNAVDAGSEPKERVNHKDISSFVLSNGNVKEL